MTTGRGREGANRPARERREITLRGAVQGVGLRPWAAREARALRLAGDVRNTASGVRVTLEGEPGAIRAWLAALGTRPPTGLRIEALTTRPVPPRGGRRFRIAESSASEAARHARIPPDVPPCPACLDELFDPRDRRHRHAFTHCTRCGPRASVLRGLPYDRSRTTLADFPPCAACRREYDDPDDRRFHAQTVTCPRCGPRLVARREGRLLADEPVEAAAAVLHAGGIVALKGYGSYHLVTDATRSDAVVRLRKRKDRPVKPFAVLVADAAAAAERVHLDPETRTWLEGPARAVVVAPARRGDGAGVPVAREVAPGTGDLGVLLPSAPLHWLLLFAPGTRPGADVPRFGPLVLTSANVSGEPALHDDDAAVETLAGLADLVISHDRPVARFSEDPVVRSAPGGPIAVRLSRGCAPRVLPLPRPRAASGDDGPCVAAVGSDLKSAPAWAAHGEVTLAEAVGDLRSAAACDALETRLGGLASLLGGRPRVVAHDLHPDAVSGELARRFAARYDAATVAVQHHHAHAAAVLVEHAHTAPALALVLDGAGYGPDGSVWGGELLHVTLRGYARLAHLERVPLPGGDAAARQPWRMALAWLRAAYPEGPPRLDWHARRGPEAPALEAALARGIASPPTSSCGRLFDAAASLLGQGDRNSHEGEAAIRLESLAAGAPIPASAPALDPDPTDAGEARVWGELGEIRVSDLVRRLVDAHRAGDDPAVVARRFHAGLAARLAAAAAGAARRTGVRDVVVTGGCLQNRLLLGDLCERLSEAGLRPLRARELPPNDAALAVGQAAVATARLDAGTTLVDFPGPC